MTQDEARAAAHLLLGPSKTCGRFMVGAIDETGVHHSALCLRLQANELSHARDREDLAEIRASLPDLATDLEVLVRDMAVEALRAAHAALMALPCVGIATVPYLAGLTACRAVVEEMISKATVKNTVVDSAEKASPICHAFGGTLPKPGGF